MKVSEKQMMVAGFVFALAVAGLVGGLIYNQNHKAELERERIQMQEDKELAVIEARKKLEAAERLSEKFKEIARQNKIDECIDKAYKDYTHNWDLRCDSRGKDADCELYPSDRNELNSWHDRDEDKCYSRY